jgi:hypothetical protein
VLCLENYSIYDLVRITDCGHCYHNYCFIKYNNDKCAICRRTYEDTSLSCFASDTDTNILDPNPEEFRNLIDFNKSNSSFIEIKNTEEIDRIEYELAQKHESIFKKFVKENILSFRFEILKASSLGKNVAIVYSCDFHENYEGLAMLYILKGPKKEGLEFFKRKKVYSLMDLLKKEFKYFNVAICSDYLMKKNYIKVYI